MASGKSRKKGKKKKNTRKRKSGPSFFGKIFRFGFLLCFWGLMGLGLLTAWYAAELPKITAKPVFERRSSVTIKAADGSILTRYGEIKDLPVAIEDLPPHLIYALLATEDRLFYEHHGIDPLGIARAMTANLQKGALVQGGSTITQQLAKNLFLSHERTIRRKIQEALLAVWLEKQLTKDEILAAYLNRAYFGSGAYGVEAAARTYFSKSARDVNLQEAALLAGLLKAPSRYSPLNNPDLASKRASVVLKAMRHAGYIAGNETTKSTPTAIHPPRKPGGVRATRYFTDWVIDGMGALTGSPETDLIIETTLVPSIQKGSENALGEVLRKHGEALNIGQGAITVMRPDGAIVAMVGGRDYASSQFNRAVQARRAPGSAFKPFLYLTALEKGWHPDDTIEDAPIKTGEYRPENFNGEYYGTVSIEAALTLSMNTASVRLMQETGAGPVIATAKRLGVTSKLNRDLSLALGSSGVPLIEMTGAYASFVDGYRAEPYTIIRITDTEGKIYYERPNKQRRERVIGTRARKDMNAMLENVILEGTGRKARLPFRAAGKTGTSQNYRDAWFIGYTDDYVAGIWLGNDDNAPMKGVTGGALPAIIWNDVMQTAHRSKALLTDTPSDNRRSKTENFSDLLSRLLGTPHESADRALNE